MKLAIGNDHSAVEMKKEIKKYLEDKGIEVIDVGTNSTESFNYPISGYKVGKMVANGEVDGGGNQPGRQQGQGRACLRVQRALFRPHEQAAQQLQHHRFRRTGHRRGDRQDDRGRVAERQV